MTSIIKKLLWFALLVNFVYVVMGVARYGSQHVDAYGIWMLKAKAWSVEGGIPLGLLRDSRYAYSHQQYPLLLPGVMAGWASLTGSLESFLWWYPLIYSVFLFLLYTLLRLEGHTKLTSLGWTTAASFMGPLMAQGGRLHAGLADIWIAVLVALCMVATIYKKPWWIVLSVMIASQIKTEGIFLLAFLVNALFQRVPLSLKKGEAIGMMLTASAPFIVWQGLVRYWQLPSDVRFMWPGLVEVFYRLWIVVVGVGKEMMNWRNWYVVWALAAITSIFSVIRKLQSSLPQAGSGSGFNLRKSQKNNWLSILGVMVGGYVAVYLFADMNTANYVSSSIDRVMLQLMPLWWLVLAGKVYSLR